MDIYKLKLTVSYQVFDKKYSLCNSHCYFQTEKKKFLLKKKRQGIGHCCREFGSPWPLVITKRSTFHGSICVPKLIHVGPKISFLGQPGETPCFRYAPLLFDFLRGVHSNFVYLHNHL